MRTPTLLLPLLLAPGLALADLVTVRVLNAVTLEGNLQHQFDAMPGEGDRGTPAGLTSGPVLTAAGPRTLNVAHPLCEPLAAKVNLSTAKQYAIVVTSRPERGPTGEIKKHKLSISAVTCGAEVEEGGGKLYAFNASRRPVVRVSVNGQMITLRRGRTATVTPEKAAYLTATIGDGSRTTADEEEGREAGEERGGGLNSGQISFPEDRHAFLVVYDTARGRPALKLIK